MAMSFQKFLRKKRYRDHLRHPHPLTKIFFHVLLLLAPPDFRREYSVAMWRDLALTLVEEEHIHGPFASLWLCLCAFGDIVTTGLRERGTMIVRDIVFALRSLRRTPMFTAVIITTLAVAIGANAAVFSVLRAVVLAPLPYTEPENLVSIYTAGKTIPAYATSQPDAEDIRAQNRVFTDVAMADNDLSTMTGVGKAQALTGILTTWPIFDVLGIRPEIGRFFNTAEEKKGSGDPLIISDHLWRTTFGANVNVVGRSVTLDSQVYRVIGVAPPRFQFPMPQSGLLSPDYWKILRSDLNNRRSAHFLRLIARLRPGVSLTAANADVNRITVQLARRYPLTNAIFGGALVRSFADEFIGAVRPLLIAAFGAVVGVVVIACANVANLLLSRSAARDLELAIRFAIGAARRRIVAQILTETAVLTVVSGVLGVLLAEALLRGFVALNPPGVPRLGEVAVDGIVLTYTFVSVGVCALASGIVPALALSRPQLVEALKVAGRGGDASRGARMRNAFVVLEIAISVALVVTSGLIVRSFVTLANTPLGVRVDDVAIASFPGLARARYGSPILVNHFYSDSLARVRAIPGVRAAAWAYTAPLIPTNGLLSTAMEGHPKPVGREAAVNFNVVSPGYFSALDVPLKTGRAFTDQDRLTSAPVIIVDEVFARTYFNGNALGHWILPGASLGGKPPPRRVIVGVVANVRTSFANAYQPNMYIPLAQLPFGGGSMLVQTSPGIHVDAAVAAAITASDPLLAEPTIQSLQTYADSTLASTRLSVVLLGSLGIVALFLAVAGVYGVVSFGVAQRTQEFGIRMALGARGDAIVRNVLARAVSLALVGILAGVVLAGFASGLVRSLLFGVGTIDPATYAVVVIVVAVAALLAALIPALRATRVDPVVALRQL
jgi:putative ABC transport system permease protein